MTTLILGGILGISTHLLGNIQKTTFRKNTIDSTKYQIDTEQIVKKMLLENNLPSSSNMKQNQEQHIIKNSLQSKFVDHQTETKDILKQFVTNVFIGTEECYFNYIKLVQETFQRGLQEYEKQRKIKNATLFIYKGGNILRLFALHYASRFPGNIPFQIEKDFIQPFFARSDIDFNVIIKRERIPESLNYEQIVKEVTYLTYQLQFHIRAIVENDPQRYFSFMKYTPQHQELLLKEVRASLNRMESLKDKNNSVWYEKKINNIQCLSAKRKTDKGYEFVNPPHDYNIIEYDMNGLDSGFSYLSFNEALKFTRNSHDFQEFNLVRTKINFSIHNDDAKILKVGGELLDVSISYNEQAQFFERRHMIEVTLIHKDEEITILTPNCLSLLKELSELVFNSTEFPWNKENRKFDKRFLRYLLLCFFIMNEQFTSIQNRILFITDFIEALKSYPKTKNKQSFLSRIKAVKSSISKIKNPPVQMKELIQNIISIQKHLKTTEDFANFDKFINIIRTNCEIFIQMWENEKVYCSSYSSLQMGKKIKKSIKEVF